MPQPKDFGDDDDREWRGNANSGRSGNSGKDARLDTWLQGLVLAGILALVGIVWTLREEVTKITSFVTLKGEQYEREFGRIDKTIERHDQRLTRLEQGRRAGQLDADDRQER